MFKIVECAFTHPIRMPVKPGIRISAGHIVRTIDYKNHVVVDISDGYSFLGVAGNRCKGGAEVDYGNVVKIFPQRMVLRIDKYDKKYPMGAGSSLYVGFDGILTSRKPHERAVITAKVISPETEERKFIEILYL
jgi:hypothetical protein